MFTCGLSQRIVQTVQTIVSGAGKKKKDTHAEMKKKYLVVIEM